MIAALYVDRLGPYFSMPDVDAWDVDRDATKYDGPHPIVAHPPCGPWGSLKHLYLGNEHALAPLAVDQVRRWGGVLEHPARSGLFGYCRMPLPGEFTDAFGGWTLSVDQVDWGHVARKRTWLYIIGVERRHLNCPPSGTPTHWISGFRSTTNPRAACPPGIKICSAQQRRRTPPAFARWLVDLAATAEAK
jgi:hypothetical protein